MSTRILEALLPPDFVVDKSSDLQKILEGWGELIAQDSALISKVANIRDPLKTDFLAELEFEAGLFYNSFLSETIRRDRLAARRLRRNEAGWQKSLQDVLDKAGFGLTVYMNYPTVNPNLFTGEAFAIVAGEESVDNPATCGEDNAVCGGFGGFLWINGDEYTRQDPAIYTVCGNPDVVCGDIEAQSGAYSSILQALRSFLVPSDQGYWPLVFFIGGAATYDISGALASIESVEVPYYRRDELMNIVVRMKPLGVWAGVRVSF